MIVRRIAALAVVALAVSACTFGNQGNPYRGLPDPPSAASVLEEINLAQFGLASYPCDLFDAPVSRCYRPDHWLGVREGREILGYVHRELTDAGARYWGSATSPTREGGSVTVSGIELGCFFDYATADYTLRVAIVGPNGEREPCVNGLPGDGVSQVWIIGATFDPESLYETVVTPQSLDYLLDTLPREMNRTAEIYGGDDATADGYYGPVLPASTLGPGVHVVIETVSVTGGYVRGLVQFGGVAPVAIPNDESGASPSPSYAVVDSATGAADVVVAVGNNTYEVPGVIRTGESVPFEIALPAGLTAEDVQVLPTWRRTNVDWFGGQRLDGPTVDAACGVGAGLQGADIAALVPPRNNVCLTFAAQATTGEVFIDVDAIVAVYAADGTVVDVITPYLLRDNGGEEGLGALITNSPDLALAWVAPTGSDASTGVWIHYAKQEDLTDEARYHGSDD